MPKVSIIIPTFNRAFILSKTISSILEQTYTDYEIIVVSNGSTDETEAVVKSFKDTRIRYLYQDGSGSPASPRNRGIKEATGQIVAFCDDDDIWLREKLQKQMEFLINNPDFGLCCTRMKRYNENKTWILQNEESSSCIISSKDLLYKNTIPLSSVIVRKDLLDILKGFDEKKQIAGAEDYELMVRISKKTKIFCIPEYLILYNSGSDRFSNTSSRNFIKQNINFLIRQFLVFNTLNNKGFLSWYEIVLPLIFNFFKSTKIIIYRVYHTITHFSEFWIASENEK